MRLESRDAARFVGRLRELARLDALLDPDPPASVVFLQGPAGVGKSTLMREFARRGAAKGWTPFLIEARDVAPLAEPLEAALAPALRLRRPLVMVDSWERLSVLDSFLRTELLPRLPRDALVVLATRQPPGSGWHTGGWEHVVLDLRLGALDAADADALLAARGVKDPEARASAVSWARGSPLALVLAADAGGAPPAEAVLAGEAPPGVAERLLPRLLDGQPEGDQRNVLAVAALARVTTPGLLARCLPGLDADQAFAWLSGHPSAEPLRNGVMLHELVGRVLRADLRRRSPELERDLRRRIVDALYTSPADTGLLQLTLDLQHLVQHPAVRWGFAWDPSGRYWIDSPRPGDLPEIASLSGRGGLAWLGSAKRYFLEAPERVTIVRDRDDTIAGYGISVTPANAPTWSAGDPVLGPRVRHAAASVPGQAAVIWRQGVDLTRERASPVTAMIGAAGIIGSGLENPAAAYLPIPRGNQAAEAFSAACGAKAAADLAVESDGVLVECHVLDYGPGGLLAFQRAAVYRELGLPPPPAPPTVEAVRDALRHYGSPALLADSPLATGGSPAQRAESVRERIGEAVRAAFGSSQEDQLARRVLTRGYLDPARTHEHAATELNLSRTAYFRQLRLAVERVAAQMTGQPATPPPAGAGAAPRTGAAPGRD
jgi:AAA ATPase-like protein